MDTISSIYSKFITCVGLTTDSRNCPEGSMFLALKGASFNGNTFAHKALEAGCKYVVVDEEKYYDTNDSRYILVENGLKALQQLANYHRRQLGTPLIGITGTNGKTTTKELIAAVLSKQFNLLYTQGNLNNSIGVPLTLLRLKPEHQLGVIEMGASHPGDIKELVDITEPNYGIITNVGRAHLQGFGSFEGVIHTKGELYDFLRAKGNSTIFIHHENKYLQEIAFDLEKVEYGEEGDLYTNGHVTDNSPYLEFDWKTGAVGEIHHIKTHLIGEYNFFNALAAACIGTFFNVPADKINEALESYIPHNFRSQLQQTESNTLIIDAYNANPTSMKASIENFNKMRAKDKLLILGDMLELGAESQHEHQQIVNLLQDSGFKDVYLVGKEFASTQNHYSCYQQVDDLIAELKDNKPSNKTILIKGSNGIRLNKVIDFL